MSAQWLRNFLAKWQPAHQPTGWQRTFEQPMQLAPAPRERTTDGIPVQYPLHQPQQVVPPLADLSGLPARAWVQAHVDQLTTLPAARPHPRKFVAVPIMDEPQQPSQPMPELQPLPHWIEASVEALAPARKQLAVESNPTLLPERLRTNSNSRPLWMEPIVRDALADVPTSHPQLADVTPADCEPDLEDEDETIAEKNKALYQLRLMARKTESEEKHATD